MHTDRIWKFCMRKIYFRWISIIRISVRFWICFSIFHGIGIYSRKFWHHIVFVLPNYPVRIKTNWIGFIFYVEPIDYCLPFFFAPSKRKQEWIKIPLTWKWRMIVHIRPSVNLGLPSTMSSARMFTNLIFLYRRKSSAICAFCSIWKRILPFSRGCWAKNKHNWCN